MRKLIVSLAAAGTALVIASPAAAQYYPQPQQYGYGYGAPQQYGYGAPQQYGYGAQNLVMRVDMLQRRIDDLRRAHLLRGDRANRLRQEARDLQRRVRQTSAYGFGQIAQGDLQMRVARLEQRVNFAASMGRYGGYGNGYGYNGRNNSYGNYGYANGYGQQGYGDRDRDHERDDRYDQDDGD